MRITKKIIILISLLILLWYFLLAHVTFFNKDLLFKKIENKVYQAYVYKINPINPIGIYLYITETEPVYVVLYKDEQYLGQSSPFTMIYSYSLLQSNPTLPIEITEKNNSSLDDSFYIVIADENIDNAYEINKKNKEWWSTILQYFH
ncbi:DUF6201 family protein [Proteus mirabilis]|uniref:DUF6201 family protein n=1 Tax=Proteus mirabilis TaxID=584 RepID=UPI0023608C74|nr:DUF6201 family protein [Proteus mirabilis]MDC9767734.1 DUF6201 family protein [Proteus mirabilis]HDT2999877.1 hypothetical protein [Proteus mirabilis]